MPRPPTRVPVDPRHPQAVRRGRSSFTPGARARTQARLRQLTKMAVLVSTGVAAFIGVTVAREHPGGSARANGTSGAPPSSPTTVPGTTPPTSAPTVPTTSTPATGAPVTPPTSPPTTTLPPTTTTTRPAVTSGGTSVR